MRYKVNDPESANQPPASAVTTTEDNSWSKQQDNEKSARTKQTRLIIVVGLLAVAVIALVVTLTLQTTIFGASGGDDGGAESKEMCQTEECIKTAARMIENLNKSVDPCEDFYDFACGGWIARNPIPQSESVWDQLISLHEELSQKLRLLLEEPDQPGEPRGVKMARAYYRTCLDTDSMEKLGMEPIYEVMARLKLPRDIPEDDLNPPKLDVAWLAGNAHRLLKLHLMVNFFISEDPRNGTLNRMMLEQVSPVLPDRHLLDPARFKSEIEEYKKYAKSMLELAGVGKRSSEFAQEIVDFSTQLAGILNTPEERRSPNHMFHDLSFQDLQMATDMNAQQWNWTTYINGVFNDTDVKIDTVKEKVIVVDMTYFQKLPQLLVLTPPSVIARYVWWCVYSTVAPLTMRRVRELGFEYSKRVYGLKENHPRWKVCVTNANNYFGMALTNMYAKRFFDEDQKQKALDMLMDIKEAFENMIGELDWMDASTRARAHRKLQAMRLWVGYPDWIHDPKKLDKHYENSTVVEHNLLRTIMGLIGLETKTGLNALRKKPDKNRWVTSGTTANAYYSVILNSVTIPAGILYPPFYGNGLESINYGAMGAIMGHELTHGFDDQGRRYNEEGVLRQWWSDETLKHYSAKVECIIKQYNNYSVPELGHNFTVNGYNTQGENIADNGGLREAYRAYSKLRKRRPKQKIALPGLLDYSQDQLFFLGYANVWCGNQTLGAYKTNLVENVHAPNRFRVIGTLSNNEDFAKAWRCPRGSPMNPVHKCVLW